MRECPLRSRRVHRHEPASFCNFSISRKISADRKGEKQCVIDRQSHRRLENKKIISSACSIRRLQDGLGRIAIGVKTSWNGRRRHLLRNRRPSERGRAAQRHKRWQSPRTGEGDAVVSNHDKWDGAGGEFRVRWNSCPCQLKTWAKRKIAPDPLDANAPTIFA